MAQVDLKQVLAEEIKEYHFHVYFFQSHASANSGWRDYAEKLYHQIKELSKAGFFQVVLGKFFTEPIGPHPTGSFEVWVPKEHFSRTYSWFTLHRGPLSVLIHPLTRDEFKDHTERAVFMGQSLPLDPALMSQELDKVPLMNPGMGLGYSAQN